MSKIKVRLSQVALLIMIGILAGGCQKHTPLNTLSWQEGDPSTDNLEAISELPSTAPSSQITYKGKKFEFRQQSFNQQPIEDTFIKKVYDASNDTQAAQAKYIVSDGLSEKKLVPIKLNWGDLVEKINERAKPFKVKTSKPEAS